VTGLANHALIPILRSWAGRRLGRRLAVVEYLGRRSGQHHELVTQYVVEGRTVRIGVGAAGRKTWWRNFESPHPLRLRLAGVDHAVTAHVEREGDRVSVVAELDVAARVSPTSRAAGTKGPVEAGPSAEA
jgi:hypothetical protein